MYTRVVRPGAARLAVLLLAFAEAGVALARDVDGGVWLGLAWPDDDSHVIDAIPFEVNLAGVGLVYASTGTLSR